MASLFRPKSSSYWWGRVNRDGRTLRKSLKASDRAVAERRLRAWVAELEADAFGEGKTITFDAAAEHFNGTHARSLRPGTRARYRTSLGALGVDFDNRPLSEIRQPELSAFERRRRAEGASAPTIRRDLRYLSVVWNTAIAELDCAVPNPVGPYLKRRQRSGLAESEARTRYLSKDEEARLIAACVVQHMGPLVAFAIDTGLRLREQLGLTWQMVDLNRGELRIPAASAKGKRTRVVPLLERARTFLDTSPRHIKSAYVFTNPETGTRYTHIMNGFKAAVRRAGLGDLRWHDLRRTCGCRLLQDHGASMEQVRDWLGHASVVTTERSYAFLRVEDLHAVARGRTFLVQPPPVSKGRRARKAK